MRRLALIAFTLSALLSGQPVSAQPISYVIHISVDGLRPDAVTALGPTVLTNFYRLRTEGAFTDNARADYDYTITLPNHTCQLTSRRVTGDGGHNWTDNGDPAPGQTLASNKGSYVAGGFDVAHDHGLRTGVYASKTKFSLYPASWGADHGAPDVTGADNGPNKIDTYAYIGNITTLVNTFVTDMAAQPYNYAFVHIQEPDTTGHANGWNITPGSPYSNIIKVIDGLLGSILRLVTTNTTLMGRTAIILTADHGGEGGGHFDETVREDYTIPFYVWGPGVLAGADLYLLNPTTRLNPGTGRPDYDAVPQPIRNGEAANLALQLLGLEPIPGSTINYAQNLVLTLASAAGPELTLPGANAVLSFPTLSNVLYDIQSRDSLETGSWSTTLSNLPGTGSLTNIDLGPATLSQQFFRLSVHF